MREHKYRAWIFNSRMAEVKTIHFGTKGIIVKDWFGNNGIDFKDIVLLEYTGLKDKNGKEIYEGDIVFVHERWNPWSFAVKYNSSELGYGMFNSRYLEGNLNQFVGNEGFLEVLGNIYENPEMLQNIGL